MTTFKGTGTTRRVFLVFLGAIYRSLSWGASRASAATNWQNIAGATGQHYTPRIGDKSHRLRCKVIAHNSAGRTAMHTPQTNAVKGT